VAKSVARVEDATPSLRDLLTLALPHEPVSPLLKLCKQLERGENIKHIFTHRRLWMQIWNIHASKAHSFSSGDLKWVTLAKLGQYGLPQPIKLLLQGLSLVRGDDLKN
jgi:A/G-specific adenine glycosylase